MHIAQHVATRRGTHLVQVLIRPGSHIARQAAGVGRLGFRLHTGQGDVRQQRRQIAPAPIDGRRRDARARGNLRHGDAGAILLFEQFAHGGMDRLLNPGAAAAGT
ncbi:hypothetical protein D3C84_988540 [compost metagenome]